MSTHQSMNALAAQVVSPADHAVLGGQLGQAGFEPTEISNLLRVVEDAVTEHARTAGRQAALSLMPVLINMVIETHRQAAMEIHRRIANRTVGLGGITLHQRCAQIAWDVAQQTPRHIPAAARPIIGSVR